MTSPATNWDYLKFGCANNDGEAICFNGKVYPRKNARHIHFLFAIDGR